MGHALVVATENGDMEEGPCKLALTNDEDKIEDIFEMVLNQKDGVGILPEDLEVVAAYTSLHTFVATGLNWLGDNHAGSFDLDMTGNKTIEKLDNDSRFRRCEELKQLFGEFAGNHNPEVLDGLKSSPPGEVLDIISNM